MTQNEKYVEGQWYGWNGGECPVHPKTVVDVVCLNPYEICPSLYDDVTAGSWRWVNTTIAFRVVKHHFEPKVIWVNEYYDDGLWLARQTKEDATKNANKHTKRVAVRYVEAPE